MERQRGVTLRFLAEPGDVNFGGKVHGGAVMKWIDQAGYTCAAGWTGTYCVTVYLGGLHFLGPIRVGEVVELRSSSKLQERVTDNLGAGRSAVPAWLDVDAGTKKGTVRGLPVREDIQIPVQEQLIVELFSK